MISARAVSRSYDDGERGQVRVLDSVSLEVEAGEFVAVVGRSGSGKSTLLNVLGGLDTGYTGAVTVAGTALSGLSDLALSRFRNEQVGFVFQSFHLVQGLTAKDNVALPAFFAPAPSRDTEARALEALTRVGLEGKAGRLPSQLSGGERQRVAIARALFARPKVLLCDEPTGNLDSATSEQVVALFTELNRGGLTVVAVTHEERLRAAASRVLTLAEGKLV
ncbi:MAG: ABC transporter ATP-binding protein [Myxococcota bacterium]